jgi:hypothetical protein
MKNFFIFCIIAAITGFAIIKGVTIQQPVRMKPVALPNIPYIGRIQILNGCGSGGAAHLMADYLRKNNFDVKNIDNADSWNFQETLVISRTHDTIIAHQIAVVLSTDNTILIRNPENTYDVTVIVGNDYRERIE